MTKKIAILGATGSVGLQAQNVARKRGYKIDLITANRDVRGLEAAAREFSPKYAVLADTEAARDLRVRLSDTDVRVLSGDDGLAEAIGGSSAETVVNSILGKAGLIPSLLTIDSGKRLALANKESLVVAGEIVMSRARRTGVDIIPVDSEHSAIFQSLASGKSREVKRILLTASGGPFYGRSAEELVGVTPAEALAHPTWKMGNKITVDSATLVNKGFEIIEAAHLFSLPAEKIEVVIHRESILHSAVEYIDNSVIAQLAVPDMRAPVQYAIDYPERCEGTVLPLDLFSVGSLSFARPDVDTFPALSLAKRAVSLGGAVPAVLNAADEVAVEAFLSGKISFTDIYKTLEYTVNRLDLAAGAKQLDEILAFDSEARRVAREYTEKLN